MMVVSINTRYFQSIDSADKAYWLGFLYADGCVSKTIKEVILELKLEDIGHLEKFKSQIDSNKSVKIKDKSCRFVVCSKDMCNDLILHGCVPKKSLILKYPTEAMLPKKFESDFIRGYFDGDGCLSFTSTMQHRSDCCPDKLYKRQGWIFKILGTYDFLTGIQKFLPVETNIEQVGKIYCIKFGGNQKVKDAMNSFYENPSVYLDRKYNKYQQLLNY